MSITSQTRFESFAKLDRTRLYGMILDTLNEHKDNGLTAREVSSILYNKGLIKDNTRQATAPRLTELVDKGTVVVIGKRLDDISGKNVAVYAIK